MAQQADQVEAQEIFVIITDRDGVYSAPRFVRIGAEAAKDAVRSLVLRENGPKLYDYIQVWVGSTEGKERAHLCAMYEANGNIFGTENEYIDLWRLV